MASRDNIKSVLSRFRSIPDSDIIRAVVYTFHARVAEHLTQGRTALLGDAAHLTPPFAGQGMNAGLRDAYNVCWKVQHMLAGSATPELLSTYETERKGPIMEMIDYAVALGEIVMPEGGLDEAAKAEIRAHLMGQPPKEGGAAQVRPKPQANYSGGWLDHRSLKQRGTLTGHVFPQFETVSTGGPSAMLDEFLGHGFALVAIGAEAAKALAEVPAGPFSELRIALLAGEGAPAGEHINTVRPTGDMFGLDAYSGDIILVRPDRFIAAHWRAGERGEIADALTALAAWQPERDTSPAP